MSQLLTGTFTDPTAANLAVDRVIALGYPRDEINVLMNNETHNRYFGTQADETDAGASIARGAAGGGMIGGTIGAIVAAVALTGGAAVTIATGGLAAPFIAGPLAAALMGGGAGAAAGSIIGAIAGAGASGDHARAVERDIETGKIVVAVNARDNDVLAVRDALTGTASAAVLGSHMENTVTTNDPTLEPGYTQTTYTQPAYTRSGAVQPGAVDPVVETGRTPVYGEPGYVAPAGEPVRRP